MQIIAVSAINNRISSPCYRLLKKANDKSKVTSIQQPFQAQDIYTNPEI